MKSLKILTPLLLILLYAWFAIRCFQIGKVALTLKQDFGAFLVYGIGLLVSIQAIINMGVNMGALPTKGLTLPFISYGGNSILIMSLAVGLVLRVHLENAQILGKVKPARKSSSKRLKA